MTLLKTAVEDIRSAGPKFSVNSRFNYALEIVLLTAIGRQKR